MISGPDGIPVVRRRTSRQLERKRDLDKIAQREKRAREKELWRKMENDMAGLQQEVNLLRDTIRSIQNYTDCKTSWHPTQLKMSLVTGGCAKKSSDEPSNARNGIEQLGPMVPVPNDIVVRRPVASENSQSLLSKLPFTDTEGLIQLPKLSEFDTPPHVQATSHTQSLFARLFVADDLEQLKCVSNTHQNGSGRSRLVKELVYPDEQVAPAPHHPLAPSPSPNSDSAGVLNTCWCALGEHATQWDCYEEHIYRALMNWHNGPGLNPPISVVSRTPTLPNLLFFEGGNVIVDCLNNVLKWSAFPNLSVQFGTYIYSYRLLRYRFFPSVETLEDVPDWLRLTKIQHTMPHPIYHDTVPFPRLRTAIVWGELDFDRAEFDHYYLSNISVNCPQSEALLVKNKLGEMVLHQDFESHALTLSNWTLGKGFAAKYPQMVPIVNIT